MDRKELEEKLIRSRLQYTRIWITRMLNSTNKEWNTEQKRFINVLSSFELPHSSKK